MEEMTTEAGLVLVEGGKILEKTKGQFGDVMMRNCFEVLSMGPDVKLPIKVGDEVMASRRTFRSLDATAQYFHDEGVGDDGMRMWIKDTEVIAWVERNQPDKTILS